MLASFGQKMKLRHATALAFVVWYTMAPPIGAGNLVELNSPLSAWERLGTFDTERECQQMLTTIKTHPLTDATMRETQRESHYTTLGPEQYKIRLYSSICFEADDPRLHYRAEPRSEPETAGTECGGEPDSSLEVNLDSVRAMPPACGRRPARCRGAA